MPIEMPQRLLFSVDTWTPASSLKRHRFLTHAHRDHLASIAGTAAAPQIYASSVTVHITLCYFPQLNPAAFVELEAGTPPLLISDPDGDFTVTALDANHCPGTLMFLFEGAFGAVLHTGDCSLATDCVHTLPLLPHPSRRIDYIFLDCTFARCTLQFPTKHDSIRQEISCIWKHLNAPTVYLVCDMLGQEDVLVEVSRAFGSKIHVDRNKNPDCHYRLSHVAPEILTDDPVSRFHIMSFPQLSDRATKILTLARSRQEPEPLILRPSSQWYAYYELPEATVQQRPVLTEPMRDEFGVWHVCLSMHSSREELEQALGILRPRWVISTTPPCIAMDLSYVKKHCCLSRLCPDYPLWKLIGVPVGMTTITVSPQPSVRTVEAIEVSEPAIACSVEEFGSDDNVLLEVAEPTLEGFEIRVEPPLTLFGHARFGLLPDQSLLWRDDYASVELIDDVEIEAMEQATESGPSKEGMAVKSVEVRNSATNSDGELKAIDLTQDEIQIFSKASEFRMDDNNVKVVKANGEADQAQEQHLNAHNCMRVSEQGENRTEAVKDISTVHTIVPSQGNMEATEDGVSPSKVYKNADNASERMGDSSTIIGSSKALSASLIRVYRSMNVPVPRPLPSLVELMGASKRRRVSKTVQLQTDTINFYSLAPAEN